MDKARKKDFLKWYDEEKAATGGTYRVRTYLEKYCAQDVVVLAEICSRFTRECMDLFEMDPFRVAPTLSSFAAKLYRGHFLKKLNKKFPKMCDRSTPAALRFKSSKIATAWLEWESLQRGHHIAHAENSDREPMAAGYRVDGKYMTRVFEFQGN